MDELGDAETLAGQVGLLGRLVRNNLARAAQSSDLEEIRELLKEADDSVSTIIQCATDAIGFKAAFAAPKLGCANSPSKAPADRSQVS
jgi:hypothetical protein